VLEAELKNDNLMMLSFGVARELGYTVQELHERITLEELLGWSCYFSILNKQQDEAMKASRRRR
jgi:hypothetical protein